MKIIAVSGTPCTGKTTLSKKLAKKHGMVYLDVSEMIKKEGLSEGYDRKMDCVIVDVRRFTHAVNKIARELKADGKKGLVVDSHMSHYLPKSMICLCIITKCSLPVLKKRLVKRGYSKAKVRENMDAEIFDICLTEAAERGHNISVVLTDLKVDLAELKL